MSHNKPLVVFVYGDIKTRNKAFELFLTALNPTVTELKHFNHTINTVTSSYRFVDAGIRLEKLMGVNVEMFIFETTDQLESFRRFIPIANNYKVVGRCLSYKDLEVSHQ